MYAAKIIRMLPIASFLQQIYALLIFTSLSLKYNKTIVDKTFDINAANPIYPKTKNEGMKDELYILTTCHTAIKPKKAHTIHLTNASLAFTFWLDEITNKLEPKIIASPMLCPASLNRAEEFSMIPKINSTMNIKKFNRKANIKAFRSQK